MLFSKITVCAVINHKIIYHRVFRALLLHIILSTVCSTNVEKLWFHCNTIFVLFTVRSIILQFQEISETIYYSLENCLLQLISKMYGMPEGTSPPTFSKTVGNTCFIFYTISSVMLFVPVSSVCTLMFLVLEGGGPRVVVSTAAFHARVRGSVPGFGGLKETKNVSSPSTCESQYCGESP